MRSENGAATPAATTPATGTLVELADGDQREEGDWLLQLRWVGNDKLSSDAGVIPGAWKQMFEILEAQNAEHNMKVTLLELYNEEITDRVSPEETVKSEDDKSKSPIALIEDWKGGFHC
ncbi:hypothetical protein S245_012045 [Arachis hypogaea]